MTGLNALDTKKKGGGVSADLLKLLALVSMTIDHYAAIVIYNGNLYGFDPEYYQMAIATEKGMQLMRIYHIFRTLGRLAFPIFAFLLTEGFIHTKDRKKYFLRVLFMGLCAEIPFDLCLFNQWFDFSAQNIGFTLAIGIATMFLMKKYRRKPFLKWTSVLGCAALSELLHFDYGALGILLIAVLYNFRKEKALRIASEPSFPCCCLLGTSVRLHAAFFPFSSIMERKEDFRWGEFCTFIIPYI